MHPVNKEWITPEELRAQAKILEQQAASFQRKGLSRIAAGLIRQVFDKRTAAQRLADAADLRESAALLEERRKPRPPATTLNPYQEVAA